MPISPPTLALLRDLAENPGIKPRNRCGSLTWSGDKTTPVEPSCDFYDRRTSLPIALFDAFEQVGV